MWSPFGSNHVVFLKYHHAMFIESKNDCQLDTLKNMYIILLYYLTKNDCQLDTLKNIYILSSCTISQLLLSFDIIKSVITSLKFNHHVVSQKKKKKKLSCRFS